MFVILIQVLNMKKEIEKFIEEKAKKITEKYHFDTFDKYFKKNTVDYFTKVKNILYKTLITPERKNILFKTYGFPFNCLFKSDSIIYFSPNFEEALMYLFPFHALDLFDNSSSEEINDFCAAEQELKLNNIGFHSFYTINELSNLFIDFATFMENNNNFLLETGWPKYMYKKDLSLLLDFSRTCPIKIPKIIEDINEWECDDNQSFIWSKEINLNDCKELIECDYQHAPILNTLSLKEVGFLEDIRPKITNLKKIILKEINDQLFSDRTDINSWYKNCIKIIFDHISKNDLSQFLHINKKYNEIHIYDSKILDDINGIMSILHWVYQEIKFKLTSSTKNAYRLILKGSIFDEQKDIISIYQWMQFAKDPYESDRVDGILTEFLNYQLKLKKRIGLNNKFIYDVIDSYKKEYLKIPLLIKPKHSEKVINFIKMLEISKKLNMDVYLPEKKAKSSQKRITPLELPSGTKWEQIVLKFIDNESIEITGPKDYREIASFREMGFENRKKLGRPPSLLWDFLRALAHTKGTFSWDLLEERTRNPKMIKDAMDNATKRKQLVNQKLEAIFNLKEDPIIYDRKNKIYQTRFTITSENELF